MLPTTLKVKRFHVQIMKKIYVVAYIPQNEGGKMLTVIFSHVYNGNYKSNEVIAKSLSMSGIVSYTFDFCGGTEKNKSDGKMTEMSIFTEESDLNNVIDMVKH